VGCSFFCVCGGADHGVGAAPQEKQQTNLKRRLQRQHFGSAAVSRSFAVLQHQYTVRNSGGKRPVVRYHDHGALACFQAADEAGDLPRKRAVPRRFIILSCYYAKVKSKTESFEKIFLPAVKTHRAALLLLWYNKATENAARAATQ